MPAAHVLIRVDGKTASSYFTLERSVYVKGHGSRKRFIKYLGKTPRVPAVLKAKYSVSNNYSWLLSKPQHVLDKFLRDYLERRRKMRGVKQ